VSLDKAILHIGLFGGSFDPVHCGHILVADSVRSQLSLDTLYFIPAAQSPYKPRPAAADKHRLAMLQRAIADYPGLALDTREMQRPGPSYSIDTLKEIVSDQADNHYYLLIGMDAWGGFEGWYQWRSILEYCNFLVLSRPGFPLPVLSPEWQQRQLRSISDMRQSRAGKMMFIDVPASPAASSDIRRKISRGQHLDGLLCPQVQAYIEQNGLYQAVS